MRWYFSLALVVFVGIAVAQIATAPPVLSSRGLAEAAFAGADTAPTVLGLAVTIFFASDTMSGSIAQTFLTTPSRRVVIVGKVAAVLSTAFAFSGAQIVLAAGVSLGTLTQARTLSDSSLWSWVLVAVGAMCVVLCYALLGMGLGMIFSSSVGAVLVYLLVLLVVPLTAAVAGIWLQPVSQAVLAFSPATLTNPIVGNLGEGSALARFVLLDLVIVAIGLARMSTRRLA